MQRSPLRRVSLCPGFIPLTIVLPINSVFFGVMDKFHAKNRCSPYAARLYARSKPLNTKNAFSAAQNRSGKMAPKMANNATDVCPVTSVSAAGKSEIPTSFGSATAKASKPPYGCSIKTIRRHPSKAATQAECALPQVPVNLNGHHLFRPKMGLHGPLRRLQQARLDNDGNRAKDQCALHAGGRCIARKRCRDIVN